MAQEVIAKLRHLRITPRKTRFIADLVRGLSVNEAQARLMLGSQRPNVAILKLLQSAIANAVQNAKLDPQNLYIKEIRVDQAPKLVRYWPRARGAMGKIEKKACHVTIVLGISQKPKKKYFTITPKPKKSKSDLPEKIEKAKKEKPSEIRDKFDKKEKETGPKPKEGGGFFRKVFRRKSI